MRIFHATAKFLNLSPVALATTLLRNWTSDGNFMLPEEGQFFCQFLGKFYNTLVTKIQPNAKFSKELFGQHMTATQWTSHGNHITEKPAFSNLEENIQLFIHFIHLISSHLLANFSFYYRSKGSTANLYCSLPPVYQPLTVQRLRNRRWGQGGHSSPWILKID